MAADVLGWIAAALTLLTFLMREMCWLRVVGVAANIAFIAYGFAAGLYPVIALHMLLLPCNVIRYCEAKRTRAGAEESSAPAMFSAAPPSRQP